MLEKIIYCKQSSEMAITWGSPSGATLTGPVSFPHQKILNSTTFTFNISGTRDHNADL